MKSSTPERGSWASLVILLGLSALVAGVSGVVTTGNVATWYAALAKPPFNPPNWLFGPVWTALYIAMAVAAWRVWRRLGRSPAMALYVLQMAFNFAWSLIFFGAHRIGAALIDILCLLAALVATTILFWRRDKLAAALLVPYLAWVSFAAILNYAIWRLN